MTNTNALAYYIRYCNSRDTISKLDHEGVRAILRQPEGSFADCFSGETVYNKVMKLLSGTEATEEALIL